MIKEENKHPINRNEVDQRDWKALYGLGEDTPRPLDGGSKEWWRMS